MNRWLALLLDAIAISLFALFARIAHQSDDMPLNFTGWLSTMLPFLAGVFIAYLIVVLPAKVPADSICLQACPSGLSPWLSA